MIRPRKIADKTSSAKKASKSVSSVAPKKGDLREEEMDNTEDLDDLDMDDMDMDYDKGLDFDDDEDDEEDDDF